MPTDDPIFAALAELRSKRPLPVPLVASHASTQPDPIFAALAEMRAKRSDPTLAEMVVPMALRVGGPILGAVAGGLVTTPTIVGVPAGVLAGMGAGSLAGETAAQKWEIEHGQRDDYNKTQMAVQTGLGMIPMGSAKAGLTMAQLVARRAAQGFATGAVATQATQLAETGEFASPGQTVTGGTLGAVLGAGGGAVESRMMRRAPTPVPQKMLPPGPRFKVTPTGEVLADGATIEMAPSHDGSYVRSVPADVAVNENRLLPAARYVATDTGTVGRSGQQDEIVAQAAAEAQASAQRSVEERIAALEALVAERAAQPEPPPPAAVPMNRQPVEPIVIPRQPVRVLDVAETSGDGSPLVPTRTMNVPKVVREQPVPVVVEPPPPLPVPMNKPVVEPVVIPRQPVRTWPMPEQAVEAPSATVVPEPVDPAPPVRPSEVVPAEAAPVVPVIAPEAVPPALPPLPGEPSGAAPALAKQPWEMTRGELVSHADTIPKSMAPDVPYGNMTEAEIESRSRQIRSAETEPPVVRNHSVGSYGIDSTGELAQLREYSIDDPILRFNEGTQKNSVVDKYAQWIRDGHEPPAMRGLETEKGTVNVTDGHHRLAAIRNSGGKTIKVWVSLTDNVPIGKKDNGEIITSPRGVTHRQAVANALAEGKPVPPAVLADYPELTAPKPVKAEAARAAFDARKARKAKPVVDTEREDYFSALLADARKQGVTEPDAVLRQKFDARYDAATKVREDLTSISDEYGDAAFFKAIAKAGGIGKDKGFPGEVSALWENSSGIRDTAGRRKDNRFYATSRYPSGSLGGVTGVLRSDGRSLDTIREALAQDPEWAHLETINDLLDEIATRTAGAAPGKARTPTFAGMKDYVGAVDLVPGKQWWSDDAAPIVGTLTDVDLLDYYQHAANKRLDDWSDPEASEAVFDTLDAEVKRRGLKVPNADEPPVAEPLVAPEGSAPVAASAYTASPASAAAEVATPPVGARVTFKQPSIHGPMTVGGTVHEPLRPLPAGQVEVKLQSGGYVKVNVSDLAVVDAGPSGGAQPRLPEGVGDAARAERDFGLTATEAGPELGAAPDRTGMLFNPSELAQGPKKVTPTAQVSAFNSLFDESGFVGAALLPKVAGGVAGATYGAATGNDPEDRLARAGLFATAGVLGASALRRGPAARPTPRAVLSAVDNVVSMPGRGVAPAVRGRSGSPIANGMKGMEPFVAKFSNPLVKSGVQRILETHGGYATQRRGVVDTETLGKFADEVKIHVNKVLPKGTPLNAEQITAYARALRQTQERVNTLASKIANNTATDVDRVALQAAKAEADVVAKSLIGARAEAGRALAAFNFWQGVMDTGDSELVREALKSPGLRGDAERLAKGLAAQPNDPIARFRWLQKQKPSTVMDKVRSYYYANILSGIKTHERNLIGNVANIVTELAVHPVAAGIDAATAAVKGAPRTVRLDELPAKAAGALVGLEQGFQDFAFTMRHGMSPRALQRGLNAGELGKFDVPVAEFAGGALNPFNVPGRLLNASDNLFRSVSRNMEAYGLAHTQATNEGLTGAKFIDRVSELLSGQTPEGVAIRDTAETFATRTVFQETPGPLASTLQLAARRLPPLSFVIPFIKTPANIMRQGLEFSVAGAAMKASRQGGRAGSQAQARAALGTAAAGYLAYLAATNRLSGEGPQNPADRAALMESGWRPNSVKMGDRWVAYSLFQPVSVQASIVANTFEAWREKGADPDTVDLAASTVFRTMNSFVSQSFLGGLFDFMEALKDPERSASRATGRIASGFIPLVGAVRTAQQAMDPTVRKPDGVLESITSGLPVLSEDARPRVDRFGEDVVREGGGLRRATDPFNVSTAVVDPIADELTRLGVGVSLPTDKMTLPDGVTMTPDQELELQRRKGRAIRVRAEGLMKSQRWSSLPDDKKRDVLEKEIASARIQASQRFRREVIAGTKR